MGTKTYHGSCICKRVRFEVQLDLSQGTFKCNCSRCIKSRFWGANAKPEFFKIISGEEDLTHFGGNIEGLFCKYCGIAIAGRGELEQAGGKFVAINLATLDDLDPKEWASAPVMYLDGRNDRWDRKPEFTGHL
jgi:hypothetical protein